MTEILAFFVKGWSMIPARIQHWLEIAALAGVFLFWFAVHERGIVMGEIRKESAKAEAKAEKVIKDLNDRHAREVAANEANHQAKLAAVAATHATDLDRVRQLDSERQAHAVLDSASSAAAAQRAEDERRFEQLEQVAAGLADALRTEQANLGLCYDDRDSLTGK
jgi:hypothetical protein